MKQGSAEPRPIAVLDDFFSEYLGCDLSLVPPGKTVITASSRRERPELLYGYTFPLWMILTQSRCAISVQGRLLRAVSGLARTIGLANLRRPEAARRFVVAATRVLGIRARVSSSSGPIFYCLRENLRFWQVHPCRPIEPDDIPTIAATGMAGSWLEHSVHERTAFAAYHGKRPVSIAGTFPVPHMADRVADIAVPGTIEEFRNQGFGRTAVAHTTRAVLELGRIPVYSTSDANVASQRTALATGYFEYGWQFRVHLPSP
ncbi:MAG: hypothetical protein ABIL25_08315 [candidate division WOR-3 bacterium]